MTCPAVCRSAVGAAAVAFLLAATHANAQSAKPTADELKSACPQLAGQSIPASSIGLASGAVTLASAAFTAATLGSGAAPATPDYCKVLGTIAPVDPAAQLIHFQINLPIAWNGKALQYGGGGFNGTLITGLAPLRDAAPGDRLPIPAAMSRLAQIPVINRQHSPLTASASSGSMTRCCRTMPSRPTRRSTTSLLR